MLYVPPLKNSQWKIVPENKQASKIKQNQGDGVGSDESCSMVHPEV